MANAIEEYRKLKSQQAVTGTKSLSPIEQYRKQKSTQSIKAEPSAIELYRQQNGITPKTRNNDLNTSDGLYNLAVSVGLKDRADEILAKQAGESTKQFFSGGFISDIFDTLSALQYGVTGVLKGKSFVEGVKTRQSFTDKDALGDKGIPGLVGGIALDIAVDPFTYIAPWTVLNKVPGLAKGAKAGKAALFGKMVDKTIDVGTDSERIYKALEGGTKAGRYLADKFVWMFGKDPIYREIFERGTKNVLVSDNIVVGMTKAMADIKPETAAKLLTRTDDGLRWARTPINQLESLLKADELAPVANFYKYIDNLGQEAVDLGLLSKETFESNVGTYIKNAYEEFELAKKGNLLPSAKVGIKNIFKRRSEKLSAERLADQIDNPTYLLFKTALDLGRDVENAKLLRQISDNFGTKAFDSEAAAKLAGFALMPTGKRLGALAGKYIPEDMAKYLEPVMNPDPSTFSKQLVANFKFFKVIMNPATHARNMISNTLLNWWKLGLGPWRADEYIGALNDVRTNSALWQRAVKQGGGLDTFAAAEMKSILNSPEAAAWGKKLGSKWDKTKTFLGDMYQQEENVAKMAAFRHYIKKGVSDAEAWKAAESATFNYAQVTPFVRKLREALWGFPFITFTIKSTPVAIETALKNPVRISSLGKIKGGIENQSDLAETDEERESEPPWVKQGFYVKLPIKDKYGRSAYFDLTYILPFGDLVSGNFFESPIKRETGMPVGPGAALASKAPFLNFIKEITSNQDFFGQKIYKDSDSVDQQLQDLFRHTSKAFLPPLVGDVIPGGYNDQGERQNRGFSAADEASAENQKRTLMQEMARAVGMKVQPVDVDMQESLQDWNKKKALTSLLLENYEQTGVRMFNSLYIPKDK